MWPANVAVWPGSSVKLTSSSTRCVPYSYERCDTCSRPLLTAVSGRGPSTVSGLASNTSFSGEYLFAGIDTDVMPMNSYLDAASPAKATFDAAFQTYFGFDQDDAQVADITPAQMEGFILDLETMFMDTSATGTWATDWSNASDQNMTSRISNSEVVQSSTNANTDGMRKFALGAVIGYELLNLNIGTETRKLVTDKSLEYIGSAITGVDSERSLLGVSEARVEQANISLGAQSSILTSSINGQTIDLASLADRMLDLGDATLLDLGKGNGAIFLNQDPDTLAQLLQTRVDFW